jgi:hypothetical protein
MKLSHRCRMCDWSPTDDRSISHPMIDEYSHTRMERDDIMDELLCSTCLKISNQMIRSANVKPDENVSKYILDQYVYELELFSEGEDELKEAMYNEHGRMHGSRKRAVYYD